MKAFSCSCPMGILDAFHVRCVIGVEILPGHARVSPRIHDLDAMTADRNDVVSLQHLSIQCNDQSCLIFIGRRIELEATDEALGNRAYVR